MRLNRNRITSALLFTTLITTSCAQVCPPLKTVIEVATSSVQDYEDVIDEVLVALHTLGLILNVNTVDEFNAEILARLQQYVDDGPITPEFFAFLSRLVEGYGYARGRLCEIVPFYNVSCEPIIDVPRYCGTMNVRVTNVRLDWATVRLGLR